MRNMYFICVIGVLMALPAYAASKNILSLVPDAQRVGTARFTYLLFSVYDASLYAPHGKWERDKPYALSLQYLRSLKGERIADRSVQEMRKQGFKDEVKLASWYTQMRDIFPDVHKDTVLTGVYQPNGVTVFYNNDQEIGGVTDPQFGVWFFGIWLAENTSEPEFRQQLIGYK